MGLRGLQGPEAIINQHHHSGHHSQGGGDHPSSGGGHGGHRHHGKHGKPDTYDYGPDATTPFEWSPRTIAVAVAVALCALLANAAGIGESHHMYNRERRAVTFVGFTDQKSRFYRAARCVNGGVACPPQP